LRGAGKRWCAATRHLRHSFAASSSGNRGAAIKALLSAVLVHPESILQRPFWGCLRRVVPIISTR
jgi:hypothetical protein